MEVEVLEKLTLEVIACSCSRKDSEESKMARDLEHKSVEELQQLASNEIAQIEMVTNDESVSPLVNTTKSFIPSGMD